MSQQMALTIPQARNQPVVSLEQFEGETGLSLVIFVDMASDQLWRFFEHAPNAKEITEWHQSGDLFDAVSEKMRNVYSFNMAFRKKCYADDPRQHVRVFVQHWVSALFTKKFPQLKCKIPNDYFVGVPLPEQAVAMFSM